MRLTKQTNYAIRILMYCAANPSALSQISEIAKAYDVSELFLFKVLKTLVKAELVKTVRGRGGGIKLNKNPNDITVAYVVRLTEESFAIAECFENEDITCPLINYCGLNTVLSKALNAFFSILEQTTIADLQHPTFKEKLGIGL